MTRTKLPADQRRAKTVEAVIELAATTNPADITTAHIATQMGVTQGALFRHFSDKQAVWTAVLEWMADTLLARIDAVAGITPIDRLRAIFGVHVDFVVQHTGIPRILFGELQRSGDAPGKARVRALMSQYRSRVVSELDQAKMQGLINEQIDCSAAATLFLGMVQGLVMQAMASDDFASIPRISTGLFEIYLDGLGVAR
jgi:AcrR family transcriptional regulator